MIGARVHSVYIITRQKHGAVFVVRNIMSAVNNSNDNGKSGRHQPQALSATMSDESAMSGVECVLSWHVLSQGQVH